MVAKLSESTEIAVPLKNIIGMFVAVAAGTGAYFSVMESINSINHRLSMVSMDMKQNSEFRIRWPRGELGSILCCKNTKICYSITSSYEM